MSKVIITGDIQETEDSLSHYGVLGMKWGIRKLRDRLAARKKRRAQIRSDSFSRDKEAIKKNPRLLYRYKEEYTTKELKDVLERLNVEKGLRGHFPESIPTKIGKGIKGVVGVGKTANEVYKLLNSPIGDEIRFKATGKRVNREKDKK